MFTQQNLAAIFPGTPAATRANMLDALNMACSKFNITTPARLCGFISQIGHESNGLQAVVENLNYSATALMGVFGRHFSSLDDATHYARQPEKIANRVYASRMGNGNETSGDGWKYKGRGLLQVTGKSNYQSFAVAVGKSLDEAVAYLQTPEGAAMSAGWYWSTHNLNALADKKDVVGMTKAINGGINGLEDRQRLYILASKVIV